MTTVSDPTAATIFISHSRKKLIDQFWPRLRACVESLTEEQVWWRPNDASNSIGNLMLHLNGNVRQWLVDSFQHTEDHRDRPAEFGERNHIPVADLVAKMSATFDKAAQVFDRLTEQELTASYEIQGYKVSGLEAVYQVVEHFGLHYGQIVYITKMLRNVDLGFYKDLNATGKMAGPSKNF